MFTGIISAKGDIDRLDETSGDWRLRIATGKLDLADVQIGDSISVSGCCLTVVQLHEHGFSADVSRETMRCTTLGELKPGAAVNLEKAMRADDRFGGHIVSGHVDGIGQLENSSSEGQSLRLEFAAPAALSRYIAVKGSICIDGTSLTVNKVAGRLFTVNIIPHTQEETIISGYSPGQKVNLEVDLIARYLERMLSASDKQESAALNRKFLERHGFFTD